MAGARFEIRGSWDGGPLEDGEHARIELTLGERVTLDVHASFYDDPAPASAAGATDRLWDHEVVELFLLGQDERYLEIELGPHGHHLGLLLEGRRRIVERAIPIDFSSERSGSEWRGHAELDRCWLPVGLHAANAYAIHGIGAARRFLAMDPVPGPKPDFHRLDRFSPLALQR